MYCSNCGMENTKKANYCESCGGILNNSKVKIDDSNSSKGDNDFIRNVVAVILFVLGVLIWLNK